MNAYTVLFDAFDADGEFVGERTVTVPAGSVTQAMVEAEATLTQLNPALDYVGGYVEEAAQ